MRVLPNKNVLTELSFKLLEDLNEKYDCQINQIEFDIKISHTNFLAHKDEDKEKISKSNFIFKAQLNDE